MTSPSADELAQESLGVDNSPMAISMEVRRTIDHSSAPLTSVLPQRSSQGVARLSRVELAEMNEPGDDYHMVDQRGTLVIDGDCAYIDLTGEEDFSPAGKSHYVLSLPRGSMRHDESNALYWLTTNGEQVEGPFRTGDIIGVGGSGTFRRSSYCGNNYVWVTPMILGCVRHFGDVRPLCAPEEYTRINSVSRVEARWRLERLSGLEIVLELLRKLESNRVAGWGFDHGKEFRAWL